MQDPNKAPPSYYKWEDEDDFGIISFQDIRGLMFKYSENELLIYEDMVSGEAWAFSQGQAMDFIEAYQNWLDYQANQTTPTTIMVS